MALQPQGWSTVYDKNWYSIDLRKRKLYLEYHHGEDDYDDDADYEIYCLALLLWEYKEHTKPVFATTPNGTIHLVDCQSREVLMSFETGEPTYAQHHSVDSKYYLDYQTDHSLWFVKTKSSWDDYDRKNFVAYDVEVLLRNKHEEYLDGGRLAWEIKTTEYLFDCKTLKIIDTYNCSDEVQSYQQKPAPVENDVVSVKRIDYELALRSKNGERLWYLRFARFDAWYEPKMRENMPYAKHYIKVYQARSPAYLICILERNDINISSESQDLLIKDVYDTKAMQDKTRLAMITRSDETDNRVSSEKKLVLDIDEDETKVIKPSKAKRGSTTINTDEKMKNGSNETDKGSNNTNVSEVNGDKDVVTNVHIHHNRDKYFLLKHPEAYLVSKYCICTLDELILAGQVQETTKDPMIMELVKSIDWLKVKRDIAEELANLHKNGIAHGNLNPHNVYMDIHGNAMIPKDPNAKNSSLTGDMAMDWYNMGRILLFIATKGTHKFCDCTDLLLIADDPEAHDITARLLVPDPDLRPTWEQVISHRLFWNPERRMSYLVLAAEYLNSSVTQKLDNVGKKKFFYYW